MFVVCGEALMDVFAAGETPTGLVFDARVGGSPFNVAVGLARLAQPVAFLGTVSRDFAGERLLRALRDEGVDVSCTPRSDARTTLGLVGLDAHGVPSYAFYGEGGADRTLEPAALDALPAAARAIHFGSYAMTVEPVAAALRSLVEREHPRRLIAYDPNVRLKVEPALERWREALAFMLPRTHLLKVSEEDLGLLFPGGAPAALAAQWLALGVALVVVTRGRDGAQAWSAQAQVSVPAQASAVIDTVGAGDSFQAALLAWLAEHDALRPSALQALAAEDIDAALRFASRAAALTCSRRGADLPRREELEAVLSP
jgi:fructokinase